MTARSDCSLNDEALVRGGSVAMGELWQGLTKEGNRKTSCAAS